MFCFSVARKEEEDGRNSSPGAPGGQARAAQAWLGPSHLTGSQLPVSSCLLPAPDPSGTGCNMASLSGSVSAEVSKPQNGAIGGVETHSTLNLRHREASKQGLPL